MKRLKNCSPLGFFKSFCLFLVGLFLLQAIIVESSGRNEIRLPDATKTGVSMNSFSKMEKGGGGMTDKEILTDKEGEYLLNTARQTIERELFARKKTGKSDADVPLIFLERRGTFVTLTIDGNLRGCIGHIIPQESLIRGIEINAINAAFRDPRFRPLTREEWEEVKIEISILTDPKRLVYSDSNDLLNKLRPEIDGVIIKKGFHQSTFLPQVWEQLPEKEDFLTHLCLKAGLEADAWRKGDLEVLIYQAQAFEE